MVFDIATRYLMYHAMGIFGIGILAYSVPESVVKIPVIIMLIGILLFSGSLYLISLKGFSKLGIITPIGGTAFIVSWVLLAINIYKLPKRYYLNQKPYRHLDVSTATSLVIASMIGTGVFTSLGYQLVDIRSVFVIIMLWIIGGIISLFGALSYCELASTFPKSGGEYYLLSKIIHPSIGFVAGLVSATVGFSAPLFLLRLPLLIISNLCSHQLIQQQLLLLLYCF